MRIGMKGMMCPLVQDLPKSTKKIHHANVSLNQQSMKEPDYVAINQFMLSILDAYYTMTWHLEGRKKKKTSA